ncbi:hypothetical protein Pelo_7000 [Pelomyxa schiedti]|nr:hypothetical protein Pelo_7000 [Pelomyxa schiedti]
MLCDLNFMCATNPAVNPKPFPLRRHVVTRVFQPSYTTSTTVSFSIEEDHGLEMLPGEMWLFPLPPWTHALQLRHITLIHRKDSKFSTNTDESEWDTHGAYTLLQMKLCGKDNWVIWHCEMTGHSSKYAELRLPDRPEHEDLYDLQASIRGNIDMLSWTNVADFHPMSVANIHGLTVQFFRPERVCHVQQLIWTPGTEFVDLEKRIFEPKYGGGYAWSASMSPKAEQLLRAHGVYPSAVELGTYHPQDPHPEEKRTLETFGVYFDEFGAMHVPLEPGRVLGCVTVSLGDTFYDMTKPPEAQKNNNGHIGRLGWAKLWVRLSNTISGNTGAVLPSRGIISDLGANVGDPSPYTYFMVNVNVPPQGAMSGGPAKIHHTVVAGDEAVLESRLHPSWIMGIHIQYINPGTKMFFF